jgi:hypothetical protein
MILFLSFSFLMGVDYYVDPAGTNNATHGSAPGAGAWATIQYAINNVADPNEASIVINISGDTFGLNSNIFIDRNFIDLTLRGAGAVSTIIDGNSFRPFYISSDEIVTIMDVTVKDGHVSGTYGGAFWLIDNVDLTIENCILKDNISAWNDISGNGFGGLLSMNSTCVLTMTNCTISGNIAHYASALHIDGGTATIEDCVFDNNDGANSGSIMATNAADVSMTDCTIKNSDACGAVSMNSASNLTMLNCTIHDNQKNSSGGGLSLFNGTHEITNTTICNNEIDGNSHHGAGIYFAGSSAELTLTNCTIAYNTVLGIGHGGGIFQDGGDLYAKNCLVANNLAYQSEIQQDWYKSGGSTHSNGYNIIEREYYTPTTWPTQPSDITGHQPNLNLQSFLANNNTANTTQTLALNTNSVAINAGDATTANNGVSIPINDQRNTVRNGSIDIGAYEYWGNNGANPANPNSEPTNHVTDLGYEYSSELTITWTENDGAQEPCGYLIKVSEDIITDPVDGVDPVDETDLRAGRGEGVVHVAYGETEYSFDFFDELTSYNVKIYPYTNSGSIIDFKTNGTVPSIIALTAAPEPSNHVLDFDAQANNPSEVYCSWTNDNGAVVPYGYLIKVSTGAVVDPVDGFDPEDDLDLSDGNGNAKVSNWLESYAFYLCSSGTTYNFKIYPYTNSGDFINYKIDGIVPAASATTPIAPSDGDLIISEVVGDGVFSEIGGSGYLEIYNTSSSSLSLEGVNVTYHDWDPAMPFWMPFTCFLSGTIEPHGYVIVAQFTGGFNAAFGFDPDYEIGGAMFDGGLDYIVLSIPERDLVTDSFNNPIDPWSWDSSNVYERNLSSSSGATETSWDNPAGTGTPGEGNFFSLASPQNVVITIESGEVTITWDPVAEANTYVVYSSDNPEDGFEEDISGTFTDESWTAPITDDKQFYQIKAVQNE